MDYMKSMVHKPYACASHIYIHCSLYILYILLSAQSTSGNTSVCKYCIYRNTRENGCPNWLMFMYACSPQSCGGYLSASSRWSNNRTDRNRNDREHAPIISFFCTLVLESLHLRVFEAAFICIIKLHFPIIIIILHTFAWIRLSWCENR